MNKATVTIGNYYFLLKKVADIVFLSVDFEYFLESGVFSLSLSVTRFCNYSPAHGLDGLPLFGLPPSLEIKVCISGTLLCVALDRNLAQCLHFIYELND